MIDEQLELFQSRLPKKPYCTDDLEAGLQIRSASAAKKRRYLQVNPPWLRSFLLFDVDRPFAAMSWYDANLPEPFWISQNLENSHAHLCYALDAPVLLGHHDRQHPMRYLAAVESAMSKALGADVGYSGLITKNPQHQHWRTFWNGDAVYELGELADWLDLPSHAPTAKHAERVGIGRNVATFDHIRFIAYRSVRGWKDKGGKGVFIYWQKHLYDLALQYTHNEHPTPLDHRECHYIAKSVAKWVWQRFDIDASDRRFSELQSARGKRGGRPMNKASARQQKPWEAEGVSRATWYRRRK